MTAEELIAELPKGLLGWYPFRKDSKLLYVTDATDNLTDLFKERVAKVTCAVSSDLNKYAAQTFDYVVAIGVLEQSLQPAKVLRQCRILLKSSGILLLGVDNRLGLRYFCGDRDKYTQRSFDGIENYRKIMPKERELLRGHAYSRYEILDMLGQAGMTQHKSYSVLPDLEFPQLIYAEDYLPKEELSIRYFPVYHYPDTVFLEEEYLYTDMIKNGLFHATANAYLLECSAKEAGAPIRQVTISADRGRENAMYTMIRENNEVVKQAAYPEGVKRLRILQDNMQELRERGISVVDSRLEQDRYVMPYLEGEIAVAYFQRILKEDKDKFISQVDRFRALILQSSECVAKTGDEIILKKVYLDMVPLNCFYVNDEFVFFDQEFYIENASANVAIVRLIDIIYNGQPWMEAILPKEFFLDRYAMHEHLMEYRLAGADFLNDLRNQKELLLFNEQHHRNIELVNTNRQRMNYSATEYQRLFVNIFSDLENRRLIIFGSGNFAKKFLKLYGSRYPVYAIIDNNADKWGQTLDGIDILSPEIVKDMEPNEYKVIVCIKNYVAVLKQLQELGARYIGIYDTNMEYPILSDRQLPLENIKPADEKPKKYRVGYIAGVFDLFHVGHLNMFKRAKEQCEYLIVGVVTDEGVRNHKKTEPFIPFEERIELVRSCRYVDEAVEIPYGYAGTRDAYRLYHFDCQFSGSDYIDNPYWLAEKEYLEKQGAQMVFFPYTESTSSSKLKKLIDRKLL